MITASPYCPLCTTFAVFAYGASLPNLVAYAPCSSGCAPISAAVKTQYPLASDDVQAQDLVNMADIRAIEDLFTHWVERQDLCSDLPFLELVDLHLSARPLRAKSPSATLPPLLHNDPVACWSQELPDSLKFLVPPTWLDSLLSLFYSVQYGLGSSMRNHSRARHASPSRVPTFCSPLRTASRP